MTKSDKVFNTPFEKEFDFTFDEKVTLENVLVPLQLVKYRPIT
jgi:hypothetical protein